jgi:NadR type nicotinamide-nucleotide adenylyltransferase
MNDEELPRHSESHGAPPPRVPRVVVTGAECTGKTTLAQQLAAHYEIPWLPEFARLFVEQKGTPVEPADVAIIARGHLQQEEAALRDAPRLLVFDTDLISTCLYSRYFFGECPEDILRLSVEREADLYLLAEPDIPWVPDPDQREGPETRTILQRQFEREHQRRGVRVVHVKGNEAVRRETATRAIDRLLHEFGYSG